jgi:hypothetical protein
MAWVGFVSLEKAMKLIIAVLNLGKSKLETISEDRVGHRRKIDVTWLAKEKTNSPPVFWTESVEGEHDYQISYDFNKSQGRIIP